MSLFWIRHARGFGSSGKGNMPMADEIRELTEQERKEQIEYHLAELKKLRAVARSDWHAGLVGKKTL